MLSGIVRARVSTGHDSLGLTETAPGTEFGKLPGDDRRCPRPVRSLHAAGGPRLLLPLKSCLARFCSSPYTRGTSARMVARDRSNGKDAATDGFLAVFFL